MKSFEEFVQAVIESGDLLADERYVYINRKDLVAATEHGREDFPMDVMDIAREMDKDPEHPLWTDLYESYKEENI